MHSGALSCFAVEGKSWAFLGKHSWAKPLTSQGGSGHPWAHPQALLHLHLKPSVRNNSCRNCTGFCAILSFLVAHILLLTCSSSPLQLVGNFRHITLEQANNTDEENSDQNFRKCCGLGFFYPFPFQQQSYLVVIRSPLLISSAVVCPGSRAVPGVTFF